MTGIIKRLSRKRPVLAVLILVALAVPSCAHCQDLEPLLLIEALAMERHGHFQFESEHRPAPIRQYRLKSRAPYGNLLAFVRRPDGQVSAARLTKEWGAVTVSFRTPFGEGPGHGIHTLYVVDRRVEDRRLLVRIAKWHTVHHSCGWGHDHKYDRDRTLVPPLEAVPLEISCQQLWDGNFHSKVQSGDRLRFRVFSYGTPAAGAAVRLISGRGWTKQAVTGADGIATFQLVRDYYPEQWQNFDSQHRERFTVLAEYESARPERFSGKDYDSVRYISSIPWTYTPSRKEYTSLSFGLSVGFITMAFAAAGVYVYRERRKRPYREVEFNEKD